MNVIKDSNKFSAIHDTQDFDKSHARFLIRALIGGR